MTRPIRDRSVGAFLDDLAGREPDPAAGAATAVTVSAAAALLAMAARLGGDRLTQVAERAEDLRAGALVLADQDGAAYAGYLRARSLPESTADREEQMTAALTEATAIPLRLADAAAEIAELGARVAADGNPRLAADAEAAAELAGGAARAADRMVAANVRLGGLDRDLLRRSRECLDRVDLATAAPS